MPILDDQIDLLQKHAEPGGQDAQDLNIGSARCELEDVVAAELSIFQQIRRSQDTYRTADPYDEATERRFQKRYERWRATAERTLALIDRASQAGVTTRGADALRGAYRQAEVLALDTDSSPEDIEAMERAAPSPEAMRALAATRRPPQAWYDQTDCPFNPEPG